MLWLYELFQVIILCLFVHTSIVKGLGPDSKGTVTSMMYPFFSVGFTTIRSGLRRWLSPGTVCSLNTVCSFEMALARWLKIALYLSLMRGLKGGQWFSRCGRVSLVSPRHLQRLDPGGILRMRSCTLPTGRRFSQPLSVKRYWLNVLKLPSRIQRLLAGWRGVAVAVFPWSGCALSDSVRWSLSARCICLHTLRLVFQVKLCPPTSSEVCPSAIRSRASVVFKARMDWSIWVIIIIKVIVIIITII